MTAAARHLTPRLAARTLGLLCASLLAAAPLAAPAAAKQRARASLLQIAFVRCSSVPFPCASRTIVTRTGHLLVGAIGMSARARVVFPVRPQGRKAGLRAVGGTLRTRTRIVVRVPGDAVSGVIRVVMPGRRYSNAMRIVVKRPPALSGRTPYTPWPAGRPSVFDGNGMWIWYVAKSQGGDPAAIAAQAQAHGVSTVYVKSADASTVWSQFSASAVAALKATGLRVCGWQFVYGDDPAGEARAAAVAQANGADCLVIDAEGAYEGKYAQAQRYMTALRQAVGPAFPVGLTSFPYVDYHPGLPYSVFMGAGGATFNLPQVYWKTIGDSVDASLAHTYAWNAPYVAPIFPLGQTYDSPSASDIVRFRQLSVGYGARGVSWWDWQETATQGWDAVGSPFVAPAPAAATPPTLKAGAGGKVGSRGDLVVWAQEHLVGAGQPVTVDGAFGASTATAVSAFQAGAGLPQTGKVDPPTWPALLRATPVAPDWTAPKGKGTTGGGAGAARAAAARAGGAAPNGPWSARLPAKRDEIPPGPRG